MRIFLVALFLFLATPAMAGIVCYPVGSFTLCYDDFGNSAIVNQFGQVTIINQYPVTPKSVYHPRLQMPNLFCQTELQKKVNKC